MKTIENIPVVLILMIVLSACRTDKTKRNFQYMSDVDMYDAVPYETYSTFNDSGLSPVLMVARKPVEGTIKRGDTSYYHLKDTPEGYELSKSILSPIEKNSVNFEKGKRLYTVFCINCHGEKGDGLGNLVEADKIAGVPAFKDRDITQGSIYHVIMYGKGIMGSHAAQLTNDERWQVVQFVEELRNISISGQ